MYLFWLKRNKTMENKSIDWSNIELLLLDFDGVFTDGFVYVDQNGIESVRCSRRDSLGISRIQEKGVKVGVISREKNPVVLRRCEKIGIPAHTGILNKIETLKETIKKYGVEPNNVCYVGDDIIDIECMEFVGIGVAVADAMNEVKEIADYVAERKGGEHAIREICDNIYSSL